MGSSPITNNRSTLAFDGKNAHISLGSMQVDYSQGYTVEAWVRYESFNHWSRIIDFGNGAGADNILLANQETTDNLYSHVFHGSTTKNLGVKTLQLNQWTHVAATIDKSHKTILYKDGEPVLDGTTWLPRSVNRTKCYIGRSNWPTDAYFQGQMAEVRIWKFARSQEQIQAEIYTRLSGAEPELVGYWPMDEGEGGVAHDRSSAAHHGSLHAATWAQAELPVKSAKRGPFGATTAGRAFVIVPPDGMAEPRIKVVGIHHAWAVAQPQVQYESLTEEPTSIDSSLQGTHFEVPRNDYLVAVSAGWGSQAPQYVRNELITLQLETYRGLKSPLYGGGSGNYDVDKFELRADEGQKIIGFFGTRGGTQDLPQRLGLYLGEITETMDDLEPALIFDGQNSSVDMGAQAAFKVPKALTLEAWVSAAAQQKWAGIVSKTYDTGSTESGYGMLLDGDGGVCFSLKPQSKSMQYLNTGKGSLELHRWHHVAMTYDGQRMTITIDGAEVKTQAVAASAIDYDPDHNLYLGMYKDDDETYPFHGKMAEVRIWNVARSLDDILNTKDQRLAGNEPGLVAYWPLSEGAGETVHDHTSNGSNAVVHLATWREHVLPALENPQPTVFEVTNTENSGPGSLRKAIRDANAAGRAAVITFNVGGGGAQTIALQQVLPNVTGSVSIDGSTQPGFSGEPLIKIQFGGIALTLRSATDATINDLDLSWTGDAAKGTAFRADYCTNLTLRNLKTANRVMGVVVAYSTDVRVLDNDLRDAGREGDQFSLYLHTIQADKLPGGIEVRGNRFGDAEGACFIYKMKDLKISDGSVQGSNIVLDKGGFDTMGGTWDVLELQQIEDTTIENLDLSYAGEEPKGAALRINGGSNVTVRNLTTANRLEGIVIVGVTDARVLDNDLRQCGFVGDRFALYLHTIEAGQLPGGVEVRGNRFGDA
ncbi:MAG: LamG-like jellyroll fold domain-containing protein, partial [Acidobacteriota bacterium]